MAKNRRKFSRPLGERRYRKLFVIASEGAVTEPQYFGMFSYQNSVIKVRCLKSQHDSSPAKVLKRMNAYLKQEGLKESDEAWLVVDKDQWIDAQLTQLHLWSQNHNNYGFALSNPNFEYWLLLHFEKGSGVTSVQNCLHRLKKYLPDYEKEIVIHKFTPTKIKDAVQRAKLRDNPPCADWPKLFGSTTVYRLVENILKA